MKQDEVASRVKRGAKRYDNKKPGWWSAENVDIEALDQSHPRHDIIGQNRKNESGWNGRFDHTVLDLETIQQAAAEGFYFTVDQDGFSSADSDTVKENEMLTAAWKAEILLRRNVK